eukprot:2656034-Pleurochrysis_carterae.AAC.1
MQEAVLSKKLRPAIRTHYMRTAFQVRVTRPPAAHGGSTPRASGLEPCVEAPTCLPSAVALDFRTGSFSLVHTGSRFVALAHALSSCLLPPPPPRFLCPFFSMLPCLFRAVKGMRQKRS